MALPLNNTFETGLADATVLTTGNSDDGTAGNAFDTVNIIGPCNIEYDTGLAAHGTHSVLFTVSAANTTDVQWLIGSVGTVTEIFTRQYIYRTAWPVTSGQRLIQFRNSSGAQTCVAELFTDGKIYLEDADILNSNTTNTFPLNEWVRLEFRLLSHATAGVFEVKMFHFDDASPIETHTRSGVNTGANTAQVRMGQTGNLNCGNFNMDDVAVSATGWLGPVTSARIAWITA